MSAHGTCYGFEVRSAMPFRFLREGDGTAPPLHVRQEERDGDATAEPVAEWKRRPKHDLHARLYQDGHAFSLWTDREGWFHIDPTAGTITVPPAADHIRLEERVWGIPAAMCYMARGDVAVHASAVEVDGGALLFGAPGGSGKTTLAAAFHAAGHRMLSEDFTCVRGGAEPAIVPGPALLRLRRDVHGRFEVPGTEVVAEDAEKVHLAIEPSRRGDGAPVPLRGVVFLRVSQEEPAAQRRAVEDALPDLFALTFKLPTDAGWASSFGEVTSLAAAVPLWDVTRPLRFDNLDEVVRFVVEACLSPTG